MHTTTQNPTEAPTACAGPDSSRSTGSATSPEIYWQAQTFWSDGEFEGWSCIGWQTKSKNVIRRVLAEHLAKHPDDKVRVRKVVMHYEPADLSEFLPNAEAAAVNAAVMV